MPHLVDKAIIKGDALSKPPLPLLPTDADRTVPCREHYPAMESETLVRGSHMPPHDDA